MKVRVPATTANIGPGFDCFGLALDIYDYVETFEGEPEENLAYKAFKKAFHYAGISVPKVGCRIYGDIPQSRGLGSSAACIIGGLMLANNHMGNVLHETELLNLAYEIEGHPDNIVPALKGGFHISYIEDAEIRSTKISIPKGLNFVIFVPDVRLSTEEARRILPKYIAYGDAVYNISRAAILIKSLITSDIHLMKDSLSDRLHQPYRFPLIPEADKIVDIITEHRCVGYFLSGSGSSIIGIFERMPELNILQSEVSKLKCRWEVKTARIDGAGAEVI